MSRPVHPDELQAEEVAVIRSSSFRAKLKAQPTVGVVLQSASPLVANSMSAAGFDWLVIDPINSPLSQLESFAMQTAVGDANPTPVLMRVGGPRRKQKRVLRAARTHVHTASTKRPRMDFTLYLNRGLPQPRLPAA